MPAACTSNDSLDYVENLLSGHYCGNFIILLSRRLINEFRALPVSRKSTLVLTHISNKLQEYVAAHSMASRTLVVHHPDYMNGFRVEGGRKVHVSMTMLHGERLHTKSFFMGEHVNDIRFLACLCEMHLSSKSYPTSLINYRLSHGGGSSLADVLEAERPTPLKGIVVVDRDVASEVPPFQQGSTASTAFTRAQEISLCDANLGWSQCNPMFGFMATWGRTLENFVGPNLLAAYYNAHNRGLDYNEIKDTFPNFPILDMREYEIWRTLNLKAGTNPREWNQVADRINEKFGGILNQNEQKYRAYQKARINKDTMNWILNNYTGSRYSSSIVKAFAADMVNEDYKSSIIDLSDKLLTSSAGDRSATRI